MLPMQPISQELVAQAKAGDETAIAAVIARMMPLIRKNALANRAPGLELDDAIQEGLIGLFEALRRYDTARQLPFVPFAAACIRHAQQDARRAATRKKHAPLNDSVPLPEDQPSPGPEEQAIASETFDRVMRRIDTLLSPLERAALAASLDGQSAAAAARRLHSTPKAVENALARARRKLREAD